ncbi:MAG: CoA transferase [Dehalococcoidia bacterium]|nr:CoA transferase [Dehalococcoidia bacterium]
MIEKRSGPLSDVRVVDLTQALAGPFCTMLLADLGADVIKVEPPRGDMTRAMPPWPGETAPKTYGGYFGSVNRNKRSIILDLRKEDDRETLFRLVETADAFTENSKVGVMDRLGVGYETLRARNTRIVYAAVRGFGDPRTGASPYAEWPAFDIIAQSMGGMVGITGAKGQPGVPAGASVGDLFPGTLAALGVVAAVHHARNSGEGQFLDVSMYDAILALCENMVYHYAYHRRTLDPRGNGHAALSPFDVYPTADGAIAVAAPTPKHWALLCAIIDRVDLIDDERTYDNIARLRHRDLVDDAVSAWTRGRTKAQIVEELGGRVPVGPVNVAPDIFADRHVAARDMLVAVDHPERDEPVLMPNSPIKLTATPSGIYRPPPLLGQHTDEVLRELGLPPRG